MDEESSFDSPLPVVSIIGLPNVGKSTLFNRLIGQRRAIVHKTPGVTRDRNMAEAEWGGTRFFLVDTGGLMAPDSGELEKEVENQVHRAISDSDLILFLVDGKGESSPINQDIADMLRRKRCPVILVANKVERPEDYSTFHEHSALGLGEPFPISALRGINCGDLLDSVIHSLPKVGPGSAVPREVIRLAVVGRPNAGKSSLINYILGEERMVVHHEAGTTRDSIDSWIEFQDQRMVLIDTAGLRRKSRIEEDLEYYANVRVIRSIDRADIVILLIDAGEGVVRQDHNILSLVERKGKGTVVTFSKWDLVGGDTALFRDAIYEENPHFSQVPISFTSSVTGEGVQELLATALKVGRSCRERHRTPLLNRLLKEAVARRSPPSADARPVNLLYMSQIKSSPPEFVIITNNTRGVKDEYRKYLVNYFRDRLDLGGVPIRIKFRERKHESRVRE
jgi:GTP-binding protein